MAYSFVRYTSNGTTTNYTFSFDYIDPSHIKVSVDGSLTGSFTFLNTSTITFDTAPTTGAIVEIRRITPKETPIVNFQDGSVLLERDLDLLATYGLYVAQEAEDNTSETISADSTGRWDAKLRRISNLSPAVNNDDALTKGALTYEYPAVSTVAGSVSAINIVAADLGVSAITSTDLGSISDSAGEGTPSTTSKIVAVAENLEDIQTVAENISILLDAVASASEAATSATSAASSATSAATSASSASTSASTATTQAAAASTSASSAATSATTATTKASEAATSQSSAAASATSASSSAATATTKATDANTAATAAATSASSAAASAASAATLLDNFDDRYLGLFSSDPTLDNDGNALVLGALYFNTANSRMKVYTATGWLDTSAASQAALVKYKFTATAAQTSFSGVDVNGRTLGYITGGEVVTLNGLVIVGGGDDYTGASGTSIVLTSGASAGDTLEVYAFNSFSVASLDGSAIVAASITPDKLASPFDLGVLP